MYLLAVRRQRDLQVRVGRPDWRHRLGGRCGGRCWRCGRVLCPDGGPGDEPSSGDDHTRGCECSEPSSLHDKPLLSCPEMSAPSRMHKAEAIQQTTCHCGCACTLQAAPPVQNYQTAALDGN